MANKIFNIRFKYINMVDKTKIPTCNILGVNIAAINMEWLLDYTIRHIKELSGNYMCVTNVHTLIMSYENKKYCNIQNEGVMAIPDGGPLSSIGRRKGYTKMARITGPSYMEEIMQMSVQKGYRHYFYGSTEETLNKIKHHLKKSYPHIKIVGMYSPPFRKLTDRENEEIIKEINISMPDFVWVGLGAPKQELWMAENREKIMGFMVGVGAGFDYMAGNIKRAPEWMMKYNLEWLYRLFQDPKRLFKRYFITNIKFVWLILIKGLNNV